eukprot:CAMPEP_0184300916 /NCGR_PEP_ID=MMETSP1049-20130417/11230_1 /TAXON_ID=77928 /ORGANISM="Proteomonas sulcata, Strain CCMP704" /LENGTH=40 /DNA_ID= /DNA_START= /DNA_END= /DNA_ORIENTATION=
MPPHHTSAGQEYGSPDNRSGDMYLVVPVKVSANPSATPGD